ncbi:Fanconi anemia group J protein homolog isoform X3 [Lycorma delicatula]|uniref:Fanconi anemia group J protein homolog isoform X3 n=1 Tax=Lycorma delicatula TaxID=130591 RepID=UPI003F50DB03
MSLCNRTTVQNEIGKPAYKINLQDIEVMFPFYPYESQLVIMNMVINACDRAEHCLIESPTGSGKTLAFLASTLTWQKAYKDKLKKTIADERNETVVRCNRPKLDDVAPQINRIERNSPQPCNSNLIIEKKTTGNRDDRKGEDEIEENKIKIKEEENDEEKGSKSRLPSAGENFYFDFGNDDDVFQLPKKNSRSKAYPKCKPQKRHLKMFTSESVNSLDCSTPVKHKASESPKSVIPISILNLDVAKHSPQENQLESPKNEVETPKLQNNNQSNSSSEIFNFPKIFYATRTHQQIDEVIKQFRIFGHKNIRMTILSSRDRTCVHPEVSRCHNSEKNEMCNRLCHPPELNNYGQLEMEKRCIFNENVDRISFHKKLESSGFPEIWDIEDLVKLGKKWKACPYFGARSLKITADIIFCPYNYLISPIIRKSMEISLKGHIIVLDEAHNIDQVCRDSVSFSLNENLLISTITECEELEKASEMSTDYNMSEYLNKILKWTKKKSDTMLVKDYSDFNKAECVLSVNEFVAAAENAEFGKAQFLVFQKLFEASENEVIEKLSGSSKTCIESLILVLHYLFKYEYKNDFNVVLEKNLESLEDMEQSHSRFVQLRSQNRKQWKCCLHFWCLNAAVIFNDVKDHARCVILTSGTLSPMDSFDVELGTTFPHKVELCSQITSDQLFATAVSVGPNGRPLMMDFKNINSYNVQDELGRLILTIVQTVPEGILLFFPSYTVKDKMCKRWRESGMLTQISQCKTLFEEPKTTKEMKEVMSAYFAANLNQKKGGLMFAIFRGKVSEGINFENEHARAVIAIGIPYPNVKSTEIRLKRAYNDRIGSLDGNEWYKIQGFRTLNQALGRVIRHKNDWGIILLVDDRYKYNENKKRLSKWIINNIIVEKIIPSY